MEIIKNFAKFDILQNESVNRVRFFVKTCSSQDIMIFVFKDISVNIARTRNKRGFEFETKKNNLEETKVDFFNERPIDICFGLSHILALTESGKCISWGDNSSGQLGYELKESFITERFGQIIYNIPDMPRYTGVPKVIISLHDLDIKSISCGLNHSMILAKDGSVYTFGDNKYLQLGYEDKTNSPEMVKNLKTIKAISCGGNHCLSLDKDGKVFIWGDNRYRQCSPDKALRNCQPLELNFNEEISHIHCGLILSLVVTKSSKIFSIGCMDCFKEDNLFSNRSRKHLFTKCLHNSDVIQKPFNNEKITEIASHSTLNLFIVKSTDNTCYVFGHTVDGYFDSMKKIDENQLSIAFGKLSQTNITHRFITLTKVFFQDKERSKLYENTNKMFNNQEKSDIKFTFGDKKIFCHKFILELQCEHMKTKLCRTWNEKDVIEITSHSYEIYYSFIKYLYTDEIELNNEEIYDLYDLAKLYDEIDLKRNCLQLIKENISIENVMKIYSFALKYELQDLEETCFEFCSNKWNRLFINDSFKMNEYDVFAFLDKAARRKLFRE